MNRIFLCAVMVLLSCGCRTEKQPGPAPHLVPQHGKVVRINPVERYVILECTVLPIEGEVITLYRDKRISGKVRAGRQTSGRLMSADIIEGEPMAGDWFRGSSANSHNRIQPVL